MSDYLMNKLESEMTDSPVRYFNVHRSTLKKFQDKFDEYAKSKGEPGGILEFLVFIRKKILTPRKWALVLCYDNDKWINFHFECPYSDIVLIKEISILPLNPTVSKILKSRLGTYRGVKVGKTISTPECEFESWIKDYMKNQGKTLKL